MNFLRNINIKTRFFLIAGFHQTVTPIRDALSATYFNRIEKACASGNSVRNPEPELLYTAREALARSGVAVCRSNLPKDLGAATRKHELVDAYKAHAAAVAPVAGSMKQLVESVHQVGGHTRQICALVNAHPNVSGEGNTAVEEVVTTTVLIYGYSKKIPEIISAISRIAFPTNSFVLDSVVEAAHARKYGSGFAVVVGEVRNLAHRSVAAAKKIKPLIEDSVAKINGKAKLVNHAGTTLYKVVGEVRQVTGQSSLCGRRITA
jgi:hypothetical protein